MIWTYYHQIKRTQLIFFHSKEDMKKKATLQHLTHVPHPLTQISENKEFKCGGCDGLGIGCRYQCRECRFNLHLHCGHCPIDLSSFMHPQHRLQLTLVQRSRSTFSNKHTACEVCGRTIGSLFYKCKRCQVYIHPLCSQLPQYVHYIDDVEHNLELQKPEQGNSCAVCGEQCRSWHYKCGSSAVSLHIECLLAPLVPSRLPPPGKNRSIVVCSSSQTTRSYSVPWWWYCIALIGILQLLRFVMGY